MKYQLLKNITLSTAVLCNLLLTFSACEKHTDDHHDEDHSNPIVTIISPIELAIYKSGDTVWINGKMEDNSVHEAVVSLMDDTTNAVLFSYTPHAHEETKIHIDTFWKSSVIKKTKATLLLEVEDHAANNGSARRKITINP